MKLVELRGSEKRVVNSRRAVFSRRNGEAEIRPAHRPGVLFFLESLVRLITEILSSLADTDSSVHLVPSSSPTFREISPEDRQLRR